MTITEDLALAHVVCVNQPEKPLSNTTLKCLRNALHVVVLACAGAAWAQAPVSWFTVQGDPANPATDTIEVNPTPLSVNGDLRTMQIRVSRSAQRNNWDGLPYRSYRAEVLFDCAAKTARYTAMEYFMEPDWAGPVHAAPRYTPGESRPMRFRDVTPNPSAQIMRAACATGSVTSN